MDPEELTEPEYRLIEIVRRDPSIIEGLIDYARGLVPDDADDGDAVDEFLGD